MSCKDCRETTQVSNVKVSEGARSANFVNAERLEYCKVRVDGCLLKNQTAADFVVCCKGVGSVVVELKGVDVEHAVRQIEATLVAIAGCGDKSLPSKFAGLIICSRYPRIDTKLQRLKADFAKKHRAPIHVVAKNDSFDISRVLSFSGPR